MITNVTKTPVTEPSELEYPVSSKCYGYLVRLKAETVDEPLASMPCEYAEMKR